MCCLLAFILGVCRTFNIIIMNDGLLLHVYVFLIVGFFWFAIIQLFSESHAIEKVKKYAVSLIGILVLYLLIFMGKQEIAMRLFTLVTALFLLVTSAPFLFKKVKDDYYWHFSQKVAFGIGVAIIGSAILMLGLWAALGSVKYLFELDYLIMMRIMPLISLFCITLLGPLYALCFVPQNFDDDETTREYPVPVGFLANWILAPLVVVYMVILYAYFGKILITGEMPKGLLAYMIAGFGAAGLVTYLTSWSCVQAGKAGKLLTFIDKHFFKIFIIPVIFQAIAIGMRIEQYGVTEKRYIVVAIVLWFAVLTIGFTFKKLQLKHISILAALFLFLGSWGPWGMTSISHHSQSNRLETLLVENGLLKDGVLVAAKDGNDIPIEARRGISSTYQYLRKKNGRYRDNLEIYGTKKQKEFFEKVGFNFVSKYEMKRNNRQANSPVFRFNFSENAYGKAIKVTGFDYLLSGFNVYNMARPTGAEIKPKTFILSDSKSLTTLLQNNVLTLRVTERGEARYDLTPIVEKMLKDNPNKTPAKEFYRLEIDNGQFKALIKVRSIQGRAEGDVEINGLSGQVFITLL
jgi:hypothetical protein